MEKITQSRFSQFGEDVPILNYIYSNNLNKGKVLEIGAFDGVGFSNVRALLVDKPGWKATFVEPSSFCFAKLFETYKMEPSRFDLLNLAVVPENQLNNSTILEFHDAPLSAVSSSIPSLTMMHGFHQRNSSGEIVNPRKIYVGKVGMKEILEKFGPFDFINIDVEGYSAELALQDWFNPLKYGCKIICIEIDDKISELDNKFIPYGYEKILDNGTNAIYALPL
jgi:FkbM family methyltransferase